VIYNFKNFSEYLQNILNKKQSLNSSYSLRAFANFLEISPGTLSDYLNNKRKISIKVAMKILNKFELTTQERDFLLSMVNPNALGKSSKQEFKELDKDIYEIVSKWHYMAILHLIDCEDFISSYSWISKRLNLNINTVKEAILTMINVGLIKEENNNLIQTNTNILTKDNTPSQAIKEYHKNILSIIDKKIDQVPLEEREISGLSLTFDKNKIPDIKTDIRQFLLDMNHKYSKGEKKDVFHLEVAFVPLTNLN